MSAEPKDGELKLLTVESTLFGASCLLCVGRRRAKYLRYSAPRGAWLPACHLCTKPAEARP